VRWRLEAYGNPLEIPTLERFLKNFSRNLKIMLDFSLRQAYNHDCKEENPYRPEHPDI
jgi:hypothetical protein